MIRLKPQYVDNRYKVHTRNRLQGFATSVRNRPRQSLCFCADYSVEMSCYIPGLERTYTYPKRDYITWRYVHEHYGIELQRTG